MLNEVAAASICLLNPDVKSDCDERVRQEAAFQTPSDTGEQPDSPAEEGETRNPLSAEER